MVFFGAVVIYVERIRVVRLRATSLLRLFFCSTTGFREGLRGLAWFFFYCFSVQVRRLYGSKGRLTSYGNVALIRVVSRARVLIRRVAMTILAGFARGL